MLYYNLYILHIKVPILLTHITCLLKKGKLIENSCLIVEINKRV